MVYDTPLLCTGLSLPPPIFSVPSPPTKSDARVDAPTVPLDILRVAFACFLTAGLRSLVEFDCCSVAASPRDHPVPNEKGLHMPPPAPPLLAALGVAPSAAAVIAVTEEEV